MSQPPSHTKATTSKRNSSRPAISKTTVSKFHSCGRGIGNVARKVRSATRTSLKRLWRGDVDEEKKVVLEKGLKRALARCSVHLLAVSATTTLAYFNLAGYFIGSQYQGLTGGVYQALDTLCLQVTAKLLVLKHPFDFPRALIYLPLVGAAYRRVPGNYFDGHYTPPTTVRKRRLAFGDLGLQTTVYRGAVSPISRASGWPRGLLPPP